jgi:hypothetical protein
MRKSQSRTSKADACDRENVLIETLKGMGANVGRPSGTLVVTVLYPALKRGANLGCPSGAGSRATPFYLGWLRVIFYTLNVQPNRAHTEKFCGIRGRIVWRTAKLRNAL